MEIKPLPIEEQIQVLRAVKEEVLYDIDFEGLCFKIQYRLKRVCSIDSPVIRIKEYIPLFRRKFAIQYANAKNGSYWWPRENDKDRLLFLDWMIQELEKQLNN